MITKVSDITIDDIINYLRISDATDEDKKYLNQILNVPHDFIKEYTGLDNKELDKYADLIPVVYVLYQDLYDTRSYYVDKTNVNKLVTTILDMHSGGNLL